MPTLPIIGIGVGIFKTLEGVAVGAVNWTVGLASKVILNTIGGLVSMLIPRSWARQGVEILRGVVTIPDYAGKVTLSGGHTAYGFAGVNSLRDLMLWVGLGLLPLTLTYSAGRALLGEREPMLAPVGRVVGLAVLLISFAYWWSMLAGLVNSITSMIVALPAVTTGLHRLMEYAVGGVALGGWQLIDLGLMAAIGVCLLGLLFMKAALVVFGAALYVLGPLMIGLVAFEGGSVATRAWVTAIGMLIGIPVLWCVVLALSAVMVADAPTAGALIAGSSTLGNLFGGLLLACTGVAGLWLCLKIPRRMGTLMMMQLSGLRSAGQGMRMAYSGGQVAAATSTTGQTLRQFSQRMARAAGAMTSELAQSGAGGAMAVRTGGAMMTAGRRGLVGSAAVGAARGAQAVGPQLAAKMGGSRAGVVASRMARAGAASWRQDPATAAAAAATAGRKVASDRTGPPSDFAGSTGRPARGSLTGSAFDNPGAAASNRHEGATQAADRVAGVVNRNGARPAGGGRGGSNGHSPGQAADRVAAAVNASSASGGARRPAPVSNGGTPRAASNGAGRPSPRPVAARGGSNGRPATPQPKRSAAPKPSGPPVTKPRSRFVRRRKKP